MLNEKSKIYLLTLFTIFILFFLQFLQLLPLSPLVNLANVWKAKNLVILQQLTSPVTRFFSLWKLSAKLEDLQYRYSEAAADLGKIQTLERENQELRKLLENSDRSYQSALITAPIVSFAQNFIAAGSQAGIRPGSAVLYKGTLLGLIDRVEEKQASVLLLSKLSDTRVLAETETGVTGLIQGNGREILLTEIKHDQSVAVGQLVFTASQVGIEKGLFIGKIARLSTTNQAQAVQTAVIEQMVNFYEVSLVEVR